MKNNTRGTSRRKYSTTPVSHTKPLSTSTDNNASLLSNMKETVIAGFGLGVGNEIAHRVVSSVLGNKTISVVHDNNQHIDNNKCKDLFEKYQKCVKNNNCYDELENYTTCLKNI
jgi:hypothetical protein